MRSDLDAATKSWDPLLENSVKIQIASVACSPQAAVSKGVSMSLPSLLEMPSPGPHREHTEEGFLDMRPRICVLTNFPDDSDAGSHLLQDTESPTNDSLPQTEMLVSM